MASISKFNSALLSIPNELTVAAANFNINFSLMKVEAPKEFHGLRDGLSPMRRHEAEEGIPHITARSLGALFESVVPSIPNLTTAYGKRVSDISRELEERQRRNIPTGLFSDRAGADGTSIWAAATSGQGAIAMHLLSCMLARMWKPAEATSLWVELVERRKQEIQETYNATNATRIASIMAAQQVFTREQLSAWDSSARSWLQAADTVKKLQQTQFLLMINNVRMPVNSCKDPYESVVKAWTSALSAVEHLICGVPQRVLDGSILLAIASWHLYPNMQVLAEQVIDIDQKDELMPSSVLTISHFGANQAAEGVFWSLPLSRMHYYSPPVYAERNLASDTSRISLKEFQIVFLGAVVAQWRRICSDERRCCNLIVRLYERFQKENATAPPWFIILAGAANRVLQSKGPLLAQFLKLLKLGGRRCNGFLNSPESEIPCFFGLEYFNVLVEVLEDVEDKIKLLRRAAELAKMNSDDVIIRYEAPPRSTFVEHGDCEFASAIPRVRDNWKRTSDEAKKPGFGHVRFAIGQCYTSSISCFGEPGCGCIDPNGVECICRRENVACTDDCHDHIFGSDCSIDHPLPLECIGQCSEQVACPGCHNKATQLAVGREGDETILIPPKEHRNHCFAGFLIRKPGDQEMHAYELILGGNGAGLFRKKPSLAHTSYDTDEIFPSVTIEEIEAAVLSSSFNPNYMDLGTWWMRRRRPGAEQQMRSFDALTYATTLYSSLNDAYVSIEVIKTSLYLVSWTDNSSDLRSRSFQQMRGSKQHIRTNLKALEAELRIDEKAMLARKFACLAWFESGGLDIMPENLLGVMALANGDSIYVTSALLEDPSVDTSKHPIRRVFGNIGRPEICLLIPPSNPRISEPDLSAWKQVNHHIFDGKLQDCFASTSLHLTFTDFEMPIDVGARGLRDRQVVLLESLVSIDDRGRKVGDLDILSMLNNDRFAIGATCSHGKDITAKKFHREDLVSLDNWDEFIELQEGVAVFRACGNWQARLSAAAAGIQTGKRVHVLPKTPCLYCLEEAANSTDADILIV